MEARKPSGAAAASTSREGDPAGHFVAAGSRDRSDRPQRKEARARGRLSRRCCRCAAGRDWKRLDSVHGRMVGFPSGGSRVTGLARRGRESRQARRGFRGQTGSPARFRGRKAESRARQRSAPGPEDLHQWTGERRVHSTPSGVLELDAGRLEARLEAVPRGPCVSSPSPGRQVPACAAGIDPDNGQWTGSP